MGSIVLGMGFTFDDAALRRVRPRVLRHAGADREDPSNAERIFPYIGGEEVNN